MYAVFSTTHWLPDVTLAHLQTDQWSVWTYMVIYLHALEVQTNSTVDVKPVTRVISEGVGIGWGLARIYSKS